MGNILIETMMKMEALEKEIENIKSGSNKDMSTNEVLNRIARLNQLKAQSEKLISDYVTASNNNQITLEDFREFEVYRQIKNMDFSKFDFINMVIEDIKSVNVPTGETDFREF